MIFHNYVSLPEGIYKEPFALARGGDYEVTMGRFIDQPVSWNGTGEMFNSVQKVRLPCGKRTMPETTTREDGHQ